MTSRRYQIQDDTRFRILRKLYEKFDVTQRKIATWLGVSASGLNYCLNALIDNGYLKVQNFSQSKNKFGFIYLLTPKGVMKKITLTNKFLERMQAEYNALRAEIESLKFETSMCIEPSGLLKCDKAINL